MRTKNGRPKKFIILLVLIGPFMSASSPALNHQSLTKAQSLATGGLETILNKTAEYCKKLESLVFVFGNVMQGPGLRPVRDERRL